MRKKLLIVFFAFCFFSAGSTPFAEENLHGQDLRMDDPPVRKHLQKHLPPIPKKPLPPDDSELKLLASLVEKGDPGEAERVAWVLGEWVSNDNLRDLLGAAGHAEPEVRGQADDSIGQWSGSLTPAQRISAVDKLYKLLDSQNNRILT